MRKAYNYFMIYNCKKKIIIEIWDINRMYARKKTMENYKRMYDNQMWLSDSDVGN